MVAATAAGHIGAHHPHGGLGLDRQRVGIGANHNCALTKKGIILKTRIRVPNITIMMHTKKLCHNYCG